MDDELEENRLSFLSKSKLELQRSFSTPPHKRINNKHLLDVYLNKKRHKNTNDRFSWQPMTIGSFTPQETRRFKDKNDTRSLYVMSPDRDSVLMHGDSMLNFESGSNSGSNLAIHTTGLPRMNHFSGNLLHTSFPNRTRTSSMASAVSVSILDLELGPKHGDVSCSEIKLCNEMCFIFIF